MKIAVFTSNQPRHIGLVRTLAPLADEIFVVQECTTAFPGKIDDFYKRSEVMQRYFSEVIKSELSVFGPISFLPENCRSLSLRIGDLSLVDLSLVDRALAADVFVVFGSSWIRGALADALVERRAINLHMGLSPWYRGTACNFWAIHDKNFDKVGGTVHLLSKGLDSGAIIERAVPPLEEYSAFDIGMVAVQRTHAAIARIIADGSLERRIAGAETQDKSLQVRYSRNAEFTDEVAQAYLEHVPSSREILEHRRRFLPAD
jgi:hypothetical protein